MSACAACTQGDNLSEPEKSVSFASHSHAERKFSSLLTTDWMNKGTGGSGGLHYVAFLRACCVGNSRVSK